MLLPLYIVKSFHLSTRVSPTAVSEELFHPWIRGALCAAAGGRGGHTAAAGCCPARGSAAAPVTLVLGNK